MSFEIWRRIPEAPEFAVSDHGRVQCLVTQEIMEEHVSPDEDFLGVHLFDHQGTPFFAPLDAMVVEAHLGPLDGLEGIIHIDGDPWNNNVWNLEVIEPYWRCKADDCE